MPLSRRRIPAISCRQPQPDRALPEATGLKEWSVRDRGIFFSVATVYGLREKIFP